MDNDTIHMTCERAEDELSGYLDDVLDPQLRQSVEAHLATCERCQEILDDFRRGDELVRTLPFIEPPPDMRDRFFTSSRYLKLARARSRQRNYVTPLSAALVAAAVLVLTLGGTLLFRQGFLATQQANQPGGTTTIGNPGGSVVPLPAGTRLIYERGGALWSAPESGSSLPQQLTPKGVQVAGWSVSPSGRMVMYIDAHTGRLHSIRADALNDTVVGTVTNGKAPVAGFWTTPAGLAIAEGIAWSPDTTHVAYVAQNGGDTALHVMSATGAADTIARPDSGGFVGHPLWSNDSVYVAFATAHSGTQSISVYNVTTSRLLTVAAQSDASDGAAVADDLAWLPGAAGTLTWSARDNGAVTGIFRADANTGDSAVRLTPDGVRYAVAGVSTSGTWLLSRDTVLEEIAAGQSSPQYVATLAHPVIQVCWAPSGNIAAVVAGDSLGLLTSSHAVSVIAHGLAAQSPVAWSPDGTALAWHSGQGVMSARIAQGAASMEKMVAEEAGVLALVWSPDGQSLAARAPSGIVLISGDGAQTREVDSDEASGRQLAWSLSG